MSNIVVATINDWNINNFLKWEVPKGFKKSLVTKKEELTYEYLSQLAPHYVFFPHWSWIIPAEIYTNFECIIFHMTDVPFGRGGSPMQNLIIRGLYDTKVSAIKAVKDLDAGPVYLKQPFDILEGSAKELFYKLSNICFAMMTDIIKHKHIPQPQIGEPIVFKRRKPADSEIPPSLEGRKLYDFIRMLDAPGYPSAFIRHGETRLEFRKAKLNKDSVTAEVTILQ